MVALPMKRVAVVGSRGYPRPQDVWNFVGKLRLDTIVVSGGAPDVDTWAVQEAQRCALPTQIIRPEYDKHPPKLAPLIRNTAIVEAADYLVGFWYRESRGTLDAVVKALDAGKLFRVYVAVHEEKAPTRYDVDAFQHAFTQQIDDARKRRLLREGF